MSFNSLTVKLRYRSNEDNFTSDFLVPTLSEAIEYKRSVGYFSTTALLDLSVGLFSLAKNEGHVKMICSPKLSVEDIQAIEHGYKTKELAITEALTCSLAEPINRFEEARLNLVATMIATGMLDIKLAYMDTGSSVNIYHEKIAVLKDARGDKIAFTGSMNESGNAFDGNFESIYTFCSWKDASQSEGVEYAEADFDNLWENRTSKLTVVPFPEVVMEKLLAYQTGPIDFLTDEKEFCQDNTFFRVPQTVTFFDYQSEAIENWVERSYCGIFDMATGTGKTYTALGALSALSQILNDHLAVIIVAPYRHLVEQWVEDINAFNVSPIIAYSYAGQKWRKEFSDAVNAYNVGALNHFCVITTNATFSSEDFQEILKKFRKNYCFVADEAHNLGADKVGYLLPKKARYRLALSATIDRYRDEKGTALLHQYFGGSPCISITLKDAIKRNYLTPYYYYPVIVYLNGEELDEYLDLTEKIAKYGYLEDEDCNVEKGSVLELLLIKRARIIAGCRQKIEKIIEVIEPYKNDTHMLVYCGATKYDRSDIDDHSQIRQIEEINLQLFKQHGMRVHKFTADESIEERAEIKELFQEGQLQVITAIKCLDEGVNIPAIRRAFILASSTNPKEYIQRRGRVLRKAPGKNFAEIFDFITLPRSLESVKCVSDKTKYYELSLIKREFARMEEFLAVAQNPSEADGLRETILRAYDR